MKIVCVCVKAHGLYSPWNSPGQNTGVGSFSLLQGIFPTQGSNSSFPYGRCEAMPRLGTWPGRRQGPWVLSMLREPPGTFSWLCTPILRSLGACSLAARTHGRFR